MIMNGGGKTANKTPPLHRLREARLTEGVSLRALARRMKRRVSELKELEDEHADITLSELYRWKEELKVPLAELLVGPEDQLSAPIHDRACLLRMAKTAKSLLKHSPTASSRRLAQTLVDQLIHMMPELEEVPPWHECGTRRASTEPSRLDEQLVAVDDLIKGIRDSD